MKRDLIGLSKFLSLILRHNPSVIGITLDDNGWVNCDELIAKANNSSNKHPKITRSILDEIVATNEKKRFAYNKDGTMIRASQGHSIEVELELEGKEPPEYLYHGTAEKYVYNIKDLGLMRMHRQHVHMNEDPVMSEKVGARHGTPKVLRIRAKEMYLDGENFYLSENNVWLVDFIDPKYIDFDWK